jgi:type IV fimbrial biogenesis protein FimT
MMKPDSKTGMKREGGFTLLELLVTITILGIVLSIGVPSYRGIVMDNRLATQANLFATSIKLARSNAVKFQRNATVCSSDEYDDEKPECSDEEDWSEGWIVWVDKDRDEKTDENEVLAVFGPVHEALTLVSKSASAFTYDARGFASPDTPAGDLRLCDSRSGEMGRLIRVNTTGRTNISRQVCP